MDANGSNLMGIILKMEHEGAKAVDGEHAPPISPNILGRWRLPQVLEVVLVTRHGTGAESVNTQCEGAGV